MKQLKALLSFTCICFVAYGCAAPTASDSETGSVAQAEPQALTEASLLALGDSIAFGYNPFGDFTKAKNFVGYPELLKSDYDVKNASCPGETSGSLLSATAPDNGCRNYRAAYPLHVNYGKNPTQIDYALSRLNGDEGEDVPTLVTLNVSGNDIFLLQKKCAADPANYAKCFSDGSTALITSIAQNVGTIFWRIRNEGGYRGRLVYMTLYSLDYTTPSTVTFVTTLNYYVSQAARQFGAQVADAYGAFQTAAGTQTPCSAGLLLPQPSGGCDVHPSALGAKILAQSVRDAQ
jgi:lysophospholipase L1-like esterase